MTLVETETIFGRIVVRSDVERWCTDLCRKWFSTYLSEVERQHGIKAGFYQRPRSFVRTISFDKMPEDQVPVVMIVSTGIATPPTREGDGRYTGRWLMGVATICSAATQEGSNDMAGFYMGALRDLFVQRPGLDGYANGTTWVDERYDDLTADSVRSLSTGQAHFIVEVPDVASFGSGPTTPDEPIDPDTDPWPLWPTVETVDIDVEHES